MPNTQAQPDAAKLRNLPPFGRTAIAAGALVTVVALAAIVRAVAGAHVVVTGHPNIWLLLHLGSVLPALPLGAFVLMRRKGDRLHRLSGRAWAALMVTAALSSFGLQDQNGGLSWIHALSVLVLFSIPRGIWHAVRHDFVAHRRTMTMTYLGLVGAGAFALAPYRLLGHWLFG